MHYKIVEPLPLFPKADGGRGQGPTVLLVWAYIPLRISAAAAASVYARFPVPLFPILVFLSSSNQSSSFPSFFSTKLPRPTICTHLESRNSTYLSGAWLLSSSPLLTSLCYPRLDVGCCWLVSWPRQCPSSPRRLSQNKFEAHVLTD